MHASKAEGPSLREIAVATKVPGPARHGRPSRTGRVKNLPRRGRLILVGHPLAGQRRDRKPARVRDMYRGLISQKLAARKPQQPYVPT